jgi:hypothetical protein
MKKFVFTVLAIAAFSFVQAQSPTDSLQEFTGKYKFPDGGPVSELTVVIDKGTLWANSAAGNSELRRTQGDVFEVIAYSGYATFKRSAEGKVNGIKVELEDLTMEGTKSESPAISEAFFKTRNSSLSMQLVE